MKRALILIGLVVLATGIAVAVAGRLAPAERVYSVEEVQDGLQRDPAVWAGRTVLVRGQHIHSMGVMCAPPGAGPTRCTGGWDEIASSRPMAWWSAPRRISVYRAQTPYYFRSGQAQPTVPMPPAPIRGLILSPRVLFSRRLVVAAAPGVFWPSNGRPTVASAVLDFAAHLPVVGGAIARSAAGQGTVFRVRLLAPRACNHSFPAPCPAAVLLK